MTLQEALHAGAGRLAAGGIENPRVDAGLVFTQALGVSRKELHAHRDRELTAAELAAAGELIDRRARREPLAYVLGEWGFRHLVLKTDARALVPRPETEIVVERALAVLAGVPAPRIVDVGTGSGAIALALAHECPAAHVTATDLSADALALAAENAGRLELQVTFAQTDLLAGLSGPFDLVVSNPPYVEAGELDALEPEVREWEPRLALVADGQTGQLVQRARDVLVPGGWLVLECHEAHASALAESLPAAGYAEVTITADLAGRERVVEGRWTPRRSSTRST